MKTVAKQAKAVVAGAIAAIAFATPLVDDGVTASEGLGIAGAFLVAWQAVYWIKNGGTESHPEEAA